MMMPTMTLTVSHKPRRAGTGGGIFSVGSMERLPTRWAKAAGTGRAFALAATNGQYVGTALGYHPGAPRRPAVGSNELPQPILPAWSIFVNGCFGCGNT